MVALAAASGAAAAPSPEAAALPGGFGVRPVVPKGKGLPPSYFVIEAGSGSVAHRSVLIINGTKRTKHLIVDGVDGLTGQTTGVVYANRQRRHREASRWVRPAKRRIQVKPGETRRLRFTVRLPRHVQPGDHVAGLAFEDAHTRTSGSRFSVKQVVRVVVGVQIHVRGGSGPQATVGRMSLQAQPGTKLATTQVRLANVGDTLCHPSMRVELSRDGGTPRVVERQLDTVLPHDAVNFPMQFRGQMPAGVYDATARVTGCGTVQTAAASVHLAAALDGSSPRAGVATVAPRRSSLPTALLVLAGVLGGVAIVLVLQRVSRRRRPTPVP